VIPDQATITATVETHGNNAKEVKKQNDQQIASVLKLIKNEFSCTDYKHSAFPLNCNTIQIKEKTTYNATQLSKLF
jgi:uncharacterized protein YggE